MNDDIWKRDKVQSPCVNLCTVHPDTGLCIGCARTLDEIATWSQMPPAERAQIMQTLAGREPQPKKRRGGRAARRGD